MTRSSRPGEPTMKRIAWTLPVAAVLAGATLPAPAPKVTAPLIGYTELRTNLPGGRHANVRTMRAVVIRADGTGRRVLAPNLTRDADTWTGFAGWSPDGKVALLNWAWQSTENAKWEEKYRQFRFARDGRLFSSYRVDLATGKATRAAKESSDTPPYSRCASPDGKRIATDTYYQLSLANADGSKAVRVNTGNSFNYVPIWSPDGKRILFLSGQHYNCHPTVVNADGTGVKKLADRGGYRGVIDFLDVSDWFGGSTDHPVWSADGKSVFYTATVGKSVELFNVTLAGKKTQ